jgi:orotate phosphoribosyltransferase
MSYKHEFIEFLINSGALRFGDFTLKSGRRSPYFINTGAFDTGDRIERLGHYYAARIKSAMDAGDIPSDIKSVFGPAYKGIPIAVATAAALAREYGVDTGYTFNRKEVKDHGEGGGIVGRALYDGDDIVLVDDVITAGTAVRAAAPLIRSIAAVNIRALFISVDRMERGVGPDGLSAVGEVRAELGFPVYAIVTVQEIADATRAISPVNRPDSESLARLRTYILENCVPE